MHKRAWVWIAAETLSDNSLRQTVHTHRASVYYAAKLGNYRPGFMTHVTCRLTAKNRDQLRNPMLGNRVWAIFTFFTQSPEEIWRAILFCPLHLQTVATVPRKFSHISSKRLSSTFSPVIGQVLIARNWIYFLDNEKFYCGSPMNSQNVCLCLSRLLGMVQMFARWTQLIDIHYSLQ